jgi:hypothetical protein
MQYVVMGRDMRPARDRWSLDPTPLTGHVTGYVTGHETDHETDHVTGHDWVPDLIATCARACV